MWIGFGRSFINTNLITHFFITGENTLKSKSIVAYRNNDLLAQEEYLELKDLQSRCEELRLLLDVKMSNIKKDKRNEDKQSMSRNSLKEAIEIAGSQSALAKLCGVKQPTIFRWIQQGFVPPRKVLLVEKVTGISRYILNPNIYTKHEKDK